MAVLLNRKTLPESLKTRKIHGIKRVELPFGNGIRRPRDWKPGRARGTERYKLSLLLELSEELECAKCGVLCEKVIYPATCFDSDCKYIYSYDEDGSTYFGCLYKVFAVEVSLDGFRELEKRKGGFGAVKVVRQPLDHCRFTVEKAYNRQEGEACREALGDRFSPEVPVRPNKR